jgi:hypothetical protein
MQKRLPKVQITLRADSGFWRKGFQQKISRWALRRVAK